MTTITIGKEDEAIVRRILASGRYGTEREVLAEGIRLLAEREAEQDEKLATLRVLIAEGLEGPNAPLDMDDIRREARRLMADGTI